MIETGFIPDKIVVVGKPYSTIDSAAVEIKRLGVHVVEQNKLGLQPGRYDNRSRIFLEAACALVRDKPSIDGDGRVILVDDGGMLTEAWHRMAGNSGRPAVSIQQTASGFFHNRTPDKSPYLKINVAGSAAKRKIENIIIAEGSIRAALAHTELKSARTVGILGAGRIGRALAVRLKQPGWPVFIFDPNKDSVGGISGHICQSTAEVLRKSDIIFGCTGVNSIKVDDANNIRRNIILISCSSRDVEYSNLIQNLRINPRLSDPPFGTLNLINSREVNIAVENWGFPINFDREKEWEVFSEIALTRALIFAAILQSLFLPSIAKLNQPCVIMLDPQMQQLIVSNWRAEAGAELDFLNARAPLLHSWERDGVAWWTAESHGEPMGSAIARLPGALVH